MRGFVGGPVEAITLSLSERRSGSDTEALTDNYLQLRLTGKHAANQWIRARVENVLDGELVGVPA